MIKAVLVFNNQGKPRIMQWYQQMDIAMQQSLLKEVHRLVHKRPDSICNFLDGGELIGTDSRIIYRHYATLYFVFVADSSESELGILDLIQVFVEALDRSFVNVCELDLIFRPDDVVQILGEIVSGGLVLETSISEVLSHTNVKRSSAFHR